MKNSNIKQQSQNWIENSIDWNFSSSLSLLLFSLFGEEEGRKKNKKEEEEIRRKMKRDKEREREEEEIEMSDKGEEKNEAYQNVSEQKNVGRKLYSIQ